MDIKVQVETPEFSFLPSIRANFVDISVKSPTNIHSGTTGSGERANSANWVSSVQPREGGHSMAVADTGAGVAQVEHFTDASQAPPLAQVKHVRQIHVWNHYPMSSFQPPMKVITSTVGVEGATSSTCCNPLQFEFGNHFARCGGAQPQGGLRMWNPRLD